MNYNVQKYPKKDIASFPAKGPGQPVTFAPVGTVWTFGLHNDNKPSIKVCFTTTITSTDQGLAMVSNPLENVIFTPSPFTSTKWSTRTHVAELQDSRILFFFPSRASLFRLNEVDYIAGKDQPVMGRLEASRYRASGLTGKGMLR